MRMTDWRTEWWCCIDRDIVWQSDNCRPCACPLHYCYYYYWWWWSCWDWWCITSTSWLHCWFNRIQRWDRTVSTSHCSTYNTVNNSHTQRDRSNSHSACRRWMFVSSTASVLCVCVSFISFFLTVTCQFIWLIHVTPSCYVNQSCDSLLCETLPARLDSIIH